MHFSPDFELKKRYSLDTRQAGRRNCSNTLASRAHTVPIQQAVIFIQAVLIGPFADLKEFYQQAGMVEANLQHEPDRSPCDRRLARQSRGQYDIFARDL